MKGIQVSSRMLALCLPQQTSSLDGRPYEVALMGRRTLNCEATQDTTLSNERKSWLYYTRVSIADGQGTRTQSCFPFYDQADDVQP